MKILKTLVRSLKVLFILISAVPILASAAAAQVHISQTAALAGGITPGDAPGFPVTITSPGNYVLDSDLAVADADTTAIDVSADNVTIDLNGFTIRGITVCDYSGWALGLPGSCRPVGLG